MKQREEYAELFAAEARDHLATIGRALVALEEGDPTGSADQIDGVFRSVHTIKGMAAAMGYEIVSKLAHNMESALAELRAGRRRVEPEVIDLLLQCSDVLESAVEAALDGTELPDPGPMVKRLVVWRLAGESEAPPNAATLSKRSLEGEQRASAAGTGVQPVPAFSLRADTSRVRVDIRKLDALMDLAGELSIASKRLGALSLRLGSEELVNTVQRAGTLVEELQAQVTESRLVPVWQVFDRFPRLVRDAARVGGKQVELYISGKELELDRSLLDAIGDPLVHLLRNAVDHGIETPAERQRIGKRPTGRVELAATREKSRVIIEIRDDGRGIDRSRVVAKAREQGLLQTEEDPSEKELFRILARPGFTTADQVTALSGRGVGLNVVEDAVRGLGGSVALRTGSGAGTVVRLELPLTLASLHALIVTVGGQVYAVPAAFARESFEAPESAIEQAQGRAWISWREQRVPLTRLQALFAADDCLEAGDPTASDPLLNLIALEFAGSHLAVSVDDFLGEEEIVVKAFDPPAGALPVFSGATVRPNGRPALVLDIGGLS